MNVDEAEALADKQRYEGFMRALRGGIAAEGNSREELEEISEELANTVTDQDIYGVK